MHVDIQDILTLTKIPGIGPSRLRSLIHHFRDTRKIAKATLRELGAAGIDKKTAQAISTFFKSPVETQIKRFVSDQLHRLNKANGFLVSLWDNRYPSNLKTIEDPPPFLFVNGTLAEEDAYSVAIVGTRTPSPYGLHMAEYFSTELARLGIPVVSGLARGIDTAAHNAAVKAHGRTVAVIGSGIDVMYPPENKSLADRIKSHGAIISEYIMGTKPDAGNFPQRNRIISGMSIATVVIETGTDGGAIITASIALEQNRDVFAVPGPVSTKKPSGTNHLIKQGKAVLLETIDDLILELGSRLKRIIGNARSAPQTPPPALSLFERKIYDAMTDNPIHIDTLAQRAGLSTSDTLVHLLSMEFKGAIKQRPGKIFLKVA